MPSGPRNSAKAGGWLDVVGRGPAIRIGCCRRLGGAVAATRHPSAIRRSRHVPPELRATHRLYGSGPRSRILGRPAPSARTWPAAGPSVAVVPRRSRRVRHGAAVFEAQPPSGRAVGLASHIIPVVPGVTAALPPHARVVHHLATSGCCLSLSEQPKPVERRKTASRRDLTQTSSWRSKPASRATGRRPRQMRLQLIVLAGL